MVRLIVAIAVLLILAGSASAAELVYQGPESFPAARQIAAALRKEGLSDGVTIIVESKRVGGTMQFNIRIERISDGDVLYRGELSPSWGRITRTEAQAIASRIRSTTHPRRHAARSRAKVPRRAPQREAAVAVPVASAPPATPTPSGWIGLSPLGLPMLPETTPPPAPAATAEIPQVSNEYEKTVAAADRDSGGPEIIDVDVNDDGVLSTAARPVATAPRVEANAVNTIAPVAPPPRSYHSNDFIEVDVETTRTAEPLASNRPAFIDAFAGLGVAWNSYQFTGAEQVTYESGVHPELQLTGQIRPLALLTSSVWNQLGIRAFFARSLGLTTIANGVETTTVSSHFNVGASFLLPLHNVWARPELEFRFGVALSKFAFAQQTATVQTISETALNAGVAGVLDILPYLRPYLGVEYRPLLSASSGLFAQHEVGPFSAHGFYLEAGVRGAVAYGLGYRAGLSFEGLGGVLQSTQQNVATLGLSNQWLSLTAALVYTY